MTNAKKLIKLAKKWQKLATIRRKRITSPELTSFGDVGTNSCSTSSTVEEMAETWLLIRRKRITSSGTNFGDVGTKSWSTSSTVEKGHFVVHRSDKKQFVLPLEYLKNEIVRELFQFGRTRMRTTKQWTGPPTLPCNAAFMEYVVTLIKKKGPTNDVEKALLTSTASGCC